MPRKNRKIYKGGVYHIISRGNESRNIFKSYFDYIRFLKILKEEQENCNIEIICYCLMPNHIHLMLKLSETNLSLFMYKLLFYYSRWFNIKYNRMGHLFQNRFKSEVVEDGYYTIELIRYIHLNPCRANLVQHPIDYQWSSFKSLKEQEKDKIVSNYALGFFSTIKSFEDFIISGLYK